MKRKIIQLAGKTLVVSLPFRWAKKYGLSKGDEIELQEDGQRLILSTEKLQAEQTKSFDLTKLDLMTNRVMGAIYKAGYEDVELHYATTNQFKAVRKCLNRTCMGMEIVEQSNKRLHIKDLSIPKADEWETVFRRLFLALLSSAEELPLLLKKNNKEDLKEIVMKDDTINRYADFCRRVINKKGTDLSKKAPPLYHIAEQLERIGDLYKDLCSHLVKKKIRVDTNLIKLLEETASFLRQYYTIFYDFSFTGMESFAQTAKELKKKSQHFFEQATKSQTIPASYVATMVTSIADLNGALLTAKM